MPTFLIRKTDEPLLAVGSFKMKTIQLTNGYIALVDDADYEALCKYTWFAAKRRGKIYAQRSENINGKIITSYMHRIIMQTPDGVLCDHKDHDTLNNQKYNLRNCTDSENSQNTTSRIGSSSQYLGVSVCKTFSSYKGKKSAPWFGYKANIRVKGKLIYLGIFPNTSEGEIEAARAYDAAAKKYFKNFANLNFPPDGK